MESIGKNKASALSEKLLHNYPFLRIKAHTCRVEKIWDLLKTRSVIIDATGDQTTSISISHYLAKNRILACVLHSWVHGHGAATLALLHDPKLPKSACYRCLWKLKNDKYRPRYELSRSPESDVPVFAACHQSFHPYGINVSVSAATQALNLLCDYLAGTLVQNLRIDVLRKEVCQNRTDTVIEKSLECPVCG